MHAKTLKNIISKTVVQNIKMGMPISQTRQDSLPQAFRHFKTENTEVVVPIFDKWRSCYNVPPPSFKVSGYSGSIMDWPGNQLDIG